MKQDIATYLVDSFIDYAGKEHNIPVIDIMQAYDDNIEQIYTLLRSEKNGNFRDGVHPYGEGIKLYAETVCKSIEKLMKSK